MTSDGSTNGKVAQALALLKRGVLAPSEQQLVDAAASALLQQEVAGRTLTRLEVKIVDAAARFRLSSPEPEPEPALPKEYDERIREGEALVAEQLLLYQQAQDAEALARLQVREAARKAKGGRAPLLEETLRAAEEQQRAVRATLEHRISALTDARMRKQRAKAAAVYEAHHT